MSLQWYPGHMAKAIREIKESLPKVDLIIEVLDARLPFSSQNPVLADLKQELPRIKIFSKHDLADPEITQQWIHFLEQEKLTKVLPVSTNELERYRQLIPLIKKMLNDKLDGSRTCTVLICGIPNVGKSTLINILTDRAVAKTGNEAAVTKGQQRIKLDEQLMLLDTPGVLWPKIHNEHSAYRQAISGAIKESITDNEDIAFYLAEYLLEHYSDNLLKRYQLTTQAKSTQAFFDSIGTQMGALKKGGKIDLPRICTQFLNEFRQGTLGQITLETPEMMQLELAEVDTLLKAKTEKDAARKKKKHSKH